MRGENMEIPPPKVTAWELSTAAWLNSGNHSGVTVNFVNATPAPILKLTRSQGWLSKTVTGAPTQALYFRNTENNDLFEYDDDLIGISMVWQSLMICIN